MTSINHHFNFDKEVNRRGTNCVKWDEFTDPDIIPLWVADMDFETAPCIQQALIERMQHGCFGYTHVPESYYDTTIQWFKRRHRWTIDRTSFIYTSGVVPAISAIIKAKTQPGNKVLVQTPVYNCFYSCIRNNGCIIEENPLQIATSESNNGTTAYKTDHYYIIDWDDFEKKCADPAVKVFLLCNPHNPAGRVWTRWELERMGEICLKHGVFVISDEIHCEFVMPTDREAAIATCYGEKHVQYTPFASISEAFAQNSAVCISPSKAFNIAGLQIANIIVKDKDTRAQVDKAININEVCDVNPFGVIALQAAYTPEGEAWLTDLCHYIHQNYLMARQMLEEALPHCPVTTLEGTYLLWVNIQATGKTSQQLADHLLRHAKVFVNAGTMYGEAAGEGYIRINLATRRTLLREGIRRITNSIHN
ncbi:MAG: pyridoxal phosphate-dependent aminotransferase [Bacteroidaceae bacterium]|nr:pyridoxal phosphate-dependent aminotransferase [Bacteroidaceae bacterium]